MKPLIKRCSSRMAFMVALIIGHVLVSGNAQDSPYSPAHRLDLVERLIDQDRIPFEQSRDHQQCWVYWRVEYRLRNRGTTPLDVNPATVSADLVGLVSNSRVPTHAHPKRVAHGFAGTDAAVAPFFESTVVLIASADEAGLCRERATLELLPDDRREPGCDEVKNADNLAEVPPTLAPFRLEPGECMIVRLRLEHQHFLTGPFDPLLGIREFTLRVGPATFRDELPLDHQHCEVFPTTTWGALPADRLDPRLFVSPPDSLYLAAHRPGHHGYDFPERPVRYDTPMRLSFWYLIAPGSSAKCSAEIKQYRDAPRSYRVLSQGRIDQPLCETGHWVHVERIIRTDPEATTLRLRFLVDSDIDSGEMWVDDISLEALADRGQEP
jgi:hypothetical protein